MIIFYSFERHGQIRMYNPFPGDTEHTHSMVYWGHTLESAKKHFRQYMGLARKHIKWIEL